jgi:hypothetical protein
MASFKREKRSYKVVSTGLSEELIKLHKEHGPGVPTARSWGVGKTGLVASPGARRLTTVHVNFKGVGEPATLAMAWPPATPADVKAVEAGDVASAEVFWAAAAHAFADATERLKAAEALIGEIERAVKETSC